MALPGVANIQRRRSDQQMNKQQQRSSSSNSSNSGSRPELARAFFLSLSLSRACHTLWLGKYCIHNDYNARQFILVSSMPITSANRRRGRWQRLPLASCRLPLATQLVALSFWRPLAVTLTCCRLRSPRTGARDRRTEQPPARVPDICGMRLQQVQRQQQHGPLTASCLTPIAGGRQLAAGGLV